MNRNKPIAITACIVAMIVTGLSTHSWTVCLIMVIAIVVSSFFWYKFGITCAWLPKEIRKNHTYIYYGCTDHTKTDIENLILGELRIKYKIHSAGYFEEPEIQSRRYREGKFRIDIETDPLIVGKEYYGDVTMMHNDKPSTTLRFLERKMK